MSDKASSDGDAPRYDTVAMTRYIEARFYARYRAQLRPLTALSEKVEGKHADDARAPIGLAAVLRRMIGNLEACMRTEALILFPAMRAGDRSGAANSFTVTCDAGHDHTVELAEIDRITAARSLPDGACESWVRLYRLLEVFIIDLQDHIRLRNEVLCSQIAPAVRTGAVIKVPESPDDQDCYEYASSPCMAHEVDPAYFDPLGVDPAQARDVARWRVSTRTQLRAARLALSVASRTAAGVAISTHLRGFLADQPGDARGSVVSGYWPIKGEPDLRALMTELHSRGVIIALPIVETKAAPLVFRRWTPETRMVRGDWDIPVPPPDAEVLTPEITLAPVMGWDSGCYRLGYGGGYFDRTLAALHPRPVSIGIGFQSSWLETIYPQPHDIALDLILTEKGVQAIRLSR